MSALYVGAATVAGGLISSFMGKSTADKNAKALAKQHEEDIAEQNRRFQESTKAARPDQHSAYGDLTWTQDPTTGQWTQTNKMNIQDEANLNKFRGIQSGQLDRAARPYTVDWDSVGLGKFAKAAGVGDWKGGGLGSGANWMVQTANPMGGGAPMPPGSTGQQASRMPTGPGFGQQEISAQQAAGMAPGAPPPPAPAPGASMGMVNAGQNVEGIGGQSAQAPMGAPPRAPAPQAAPVAPPPAAAAPIQDPAAMAAALRKQQEEAQMQQASMYTAGGANQGGGA